MLRTRSWRHSDRHTTPSHVGAGTSGASAAQRQPATAYSSPSAPHAVTTAVPTSSSAAHATPVTSKPATDRSVSVAAEKSYPASAAQAGVGLTH